MTTIQEITKSLEHASQIEISYEYTYCKVVKPVRQFLAGYSGSLRAYLTDRVELLESKLMAKELL